MDSYPPLARRFIIRTLLIRYNKLLKKAKDIYKIPDEKFIELCEKFLNPEYVCGTLVHYLEEDSDDDLEDDSDDSDNE